MPDHHITSRLENGKVDPKERTAIERSIKSRESAPTTSEQSGSFVDWQQVRDQLGQPFDAERIPLRKLRQMRRDAMIAFGLHYRKTPLVRAQWHVDARDNDGPNAQVAAFMDAAWRQIHARYIFQHTTDFEFGWAAMVRRFKESNPGGFYFDPEETDPEQAMKPAWDEGNVLPIIWKPFVGLPPERVEPVFTDDGDFNGFIYELPASRAQRGKRGKAGDDDRKREIDVYHALWATNDKDSVFGSIYGYPLIAHAYRFWWSYWFLWANLDRAFERMAVPPMVAYHPEGNYTDLESGDERPYWEIAIEAAERLRSNAVAAVPSTLATAGLDERGTQQREWAFEFLETPHQSFDTLNEHLSYLDVMKLRAIWVPEQAFIEGEGGTSSRNVAAQMAEIFLESQANKWEEIADHINRYIFPQLLAVNFPEFVNNGGSARIIGHGFAKEDTEFLKQIIQLIGQQDPLSLGVDIREAMTRIGAPLKSPAEIARDQAEAIRQSQASGPPNVSPQPGQVGTVPNPGFTNGGSVPEPNAPGATATGFADQPFIYINPRPVIELSDHDDFLAALPQSSHYTDKTMRALAVQLRKVWLAALREMYPDFARHVADSKLELTDEEEREHILDPELHFDLDDEPDIELAERRSRRKAERLANRLINEWSLSSQRLDRLAGSSRVIIERMLKRAAKVVQNNANLKVDVTEEAWEDYLESQVGRLIKSVEKTTKDNLRSLLVRDIMEGKTGKQIADNIRDHFSEFPDFRADRIARSETRDAFNAATLTVAENAKLKYVRAKDAQHGPTDEMCEERNGKLYTIREAWKEMTPRRTHPNDTLEFQPIARASFSIEIVSEMPEDAPENAVAWFDDETDTAYLTDNLSWDDHEAFLSALATKLVSDA